MADLNTCPSRADLERLLLGRLEDTEAGDIERHLATCAHCLDLCRTSLLEDPLVRDVRAAGSAPGWYVGGADDRLLPRLYQLSGSPGATGLDEFGDDHDPPQGPDEIGRVGAYRLLQVLGSGGMGVVYLARHGSLERLAAVKMIRAGAGAGPERLARFRREMALVARVHHPNIVQIYEVGETEPGPGRAPLPWFAMEYVEGETLSRRLAAGPLAPRPAAALAETLARAVQAAHERGVIHRDLKPANILLQNSTTDNTDNTDKEKRGAHSAGGGAAPGPSDPCYPWSSFVRIADFGLAKQLDAGEATAGYDTHSGAILGTPGYMAPEQATGRGDDVGPAADVYALGAILYECLTGRPPFRAATFLETLDLVRTRDPVPPRLVRPGVPRDVQTVCLKCLAKDPARRYPTAQELADDLERFLHCRPIRARPVGPAERLVKWSRRHPALAALVAFGSLGVVGVILGVLEHNARLRVEVERAEREQQRADANYRQARDALNRMLARADAPHRAGLPRLKELRREQQEDALDFYLAVAQQQSQDAEVRADIGEACLQAGRLQWELDRPAEARENLGSAIALFAGLAAENPHEARYRARQAHALNTLGNSLGVTEEAVRSHREALALQEALLREDPGSTDYRAAVAVSHHNLGAAAWKNNKAAEAEDHCRRAIALRTELVRARPDEREERAALAQTQVNLLEVLRQTSGRAEALALHKAVEANLERLVAEDAHDLASLVSLAALRNNWAHELAAKGKVEEALADLGKNVSVLEAVLAKEPQLLTARDMLFRTQGIRAQLLEVRNRWDQAASAWQRVIELAPTEQRQVMRLFHVMALARAGDADRAMAGVEALARELPPQGDWRHWYHLARVSAACAAGVRPGKTVSTSGSDPRRERCAAQAAEMLARAKEAAGPQEWRKLIPGLLRDKDFRPLLSRPDFQRLTSQ